MSYHANKKCTIFYSAIRSLFEQAMKTSTLQLAPAYLTLVRNILKKDLPDRHVIAFGSRVTGTHKKHADLDLCVMGNQPLSLSHLAQLHEDFSTSDLPVRVDVVDWATTSTAFRAIIQQSFFEMT